MKKWVGVMMTAALVVANSVAASEGTAELVNVEGEDARCWAGSVLLKSFSYKVIVSCRDLTYPAADEDVFDYGFWIVPADGKPPVKLGVLGVGKAEFGSNVRFLTVLVTKEGRQQAGQKMGPVVMRGEMTPIRFLETGIGEAIPTLTPILRPTAALGTAEGQAPEQVAAKGVRLGATILKVVGVAFVLGIGAIVVVIVVSSLGSKRNVPPGL